MSLVPASKPLLDLTPGSTSTILLVDDGGAVLDDYTVDGASVSGEFFVIFGVTYDAEISPISETMSALILSDPVISLAAFVPEEYKKKGVTPYKRITIDGIVNFTLTDSLGIPAPLTLDCSYVN